VTPAASVAIVSIIKLNSFLKGMFIVQLLSEGCNKVIMMDVNRIGNISNTMSTPLISSRSPSLVHFFGITKYISFSNLNLIHLFQFVT